MSMVRLSLMFGLCPVATAFMGRTLLLSGAPSLAECAGWVFAACSPVFIGLLLSQTESVPVSRLLYDLEHPNEVARNLREKRRSIGR